MRLTLAEFCQTSTEPSDHCQSWLERELNVAAHAAEMADSLSTLIQHLNEGIQTDTYRMLPNSSFERLDKFGPVTQSFISLLELPSEEYHALWVDDRFVTGQRFENNAILGINDLLYFMHLSQELTDEDYYDYLIKLRTANVRYIPITIKELDYHLRNAIQVDREFQETPELRTIRQYVSACMEFPTDLQYPLETDDPLHLPLNELAFVGNLKLVVYKSLAHIWTTFAESEARHQASLWVVESLFLDYMAMIEYCHGQLEDFTQYRLIPDLASICLQHLTVAMSENPSPEELELQTSLRHEFSDWTWSYIIHPRVAVEPQLMQAICRRVKVMMYETVDSLEYEEVKRTDLVKKLVLQSVYNALAESVQAQLAQDEEFLGTIGLQPSIGVAGLSFEVREFWNAIGAALDGQDANIEGVYDNHLVQVVLLREEENGQAKIEFVHPGDKKKRTFKIDHAGLLATARATQLKDLQNKRYWVDCGLEQFDRIVQAVSNANDAFERLTIIEEYLSSSSTVYYGRLAALLQDSKHGDPLYFSDLVPGSLLGLLRHFRLSVVEKDFAQNYENAASALIAEGDLTVAIQRFAILPLPLPAELMGAFASATRDDQVKAINTLENSQSPITQIHVLHLRLSLGEIDKVSEGMNDLTSEAGLQALTAFLSILGSAYHLIRRHEEAKQLSDELLLLITWVHTHYLYAILKRIGHTSEAIIQMFDVNVEAAQLSFDELRASVNSDTLHPQRITARGMILSSVAYVQSTYDELFFSETLQENILILIFIPDTNNTQFHPAVYADVSRCTNIFGSFLNFDWPTDLISKLPQGTMLPDSSSRATAINDSLNELRADHTLIHPWQTLAYILQDLVIDNELQAALVDLFQSVEFLEMYRLNPELGFASTNLAFLQLFHLNNSELSTRLEALIPELALFLSRKSKEIIEDNPDQKLFSLVVNTLIIPTIRLSATKEYADETFIKLSKAIVNVWPDTIPILYNVTDRIYHHLPAELQPQYWSLLMTLRSRK